MLAKFLVVVTVCLAASYSTSLLAADVKAVGAVRTWFRGAVVEAPEQLQARGHGECRPRGTRG